MLRWRALARWSGGAVARFGALWGGEVLQRRQGERWKTGREEGRKGGREEGRKELMEEGRKGGREEGRKVKDQRSTVRSIIIITFCT